MNVIYEPHPVAPERKAELREQALKIIDARFKPDESQSMDSVLTPAGVIPLVATDATQPEQAQTEPAKPARKPRAK